MRFFHKSIASELKDIRLTRTMRSSGTVALICNSQKYHRDYNSAQNNYYLKTLIITDFFTRPSSSRYLLFTTLVYLVNELFVGRNYTKTVDIPQIRE